MGRNEVRDIDATKLEDYEDDWTGDQIPSEPNEPYSSDIGEKLPMYNL